MSTRSALIVAALIAAASAPTVAQSGGHVEVTGFGGWVFSDGVEGNSIVAGDGNIYDRIDPKDSGSYGFSVGVMTTDHVAVGFMYVNQLSELLVSGTNERTIGDMSIKNYHGYVEYKFGAPDAVARPFIFGGFGATNYASVDVTVAGVNRSIGGETQFSSTWGGGVKAYFSPHVGGLAQFRFTPTYIKSDPGGWWCDPYWGCYAVGDPQYSNQVEFAGGITLRF
jgi:hypothetical protein